MVGPVNGKIYRLQVKATTSWKWHECELILWSFGLINSTFIIGIIF